MGLNWGENFQALITAEEMHRDASGPRFQGIFPGFLSWCLFWRTLFSPTCRGPGWLTKLLLTLHARCLVRRILIHGIKRDQLTPMAVPWARPPLIKVWLAQRPTPKQPPFPLELLQPLTNLLCYHQCQLEAKPRVPLKRCEQREQGHGPELRAISLAKPTLEGQHEEQTHPVHPKTFQGGLRVTAPSRQQDNNTDSRLSFPQPHLPALAGASFPPQSCIDWTSLSLPICSNKRVWRWLFQISVKVSEHEPEPSLLLSCWRLPWLLWCNNTWKLLFFETNLNTLNCWKIKNRSQLITLTLISYSANESLFITT